jgi:hypothetical protein
MLSWQHRVASQYNWHQPDLQSGSCCSLQQTVC